MSPLILASIFSYERSRSEQKNQETHEVYSFSIVIVYMKICHILCEKMNFLPFSILSWVFCNLKLKKNLELIQHLSSRALLKPSFVWHLIQSFFMTFEINGIYIQWHCESTYSKPRCHGLSFLVSIFFK